MQFLPRRLNCIHFKKNTIKYTNTLFDVNLKSSSNDKFGAKRSLAFDDKICHAERCSRPHVFARRTARDITVIGRNLRGGAKCEQCQYAHCRDFFEQMVDLKK